MSLDTKSTYDICEKCIRPCCQYLPKPKYCKIATHCEFYDSKKCSKYVSMEFRKRLDIGRPLVCELFPAVVDLPVSDGKNIKIDILQHSFCKYASEILERPSEQEKIKEIIGFVFSRAEKNEHVDMLWGQFQIIRQEILKNPGYNLEINFTNRAID